MPLYDHRVFRHRNEWWVAEVHSASGAGAGPGIHVTEDRVTFTCLSNDRRESRTATIPTGFLNQINHASVVSLLERAEPYGTRFEMSPYNAPDAVQLANLPKIADDEGLRWVVRRTFHGEPERFALVEVICLDDSALKREFVVPRAALPKEVDITGVFGDDNVLVATVKRTFAAYQGEEVDEGRVTRPNRGQVAAIEAWLRSKFLDAFVESGHISAREVQLFRARDKRAPAPAKEIEISDETFEDYPVKSIVDALERQNAAKELAEHPDQRLLLTRDLVLQVSPYDTRHS